MIEEHDFLVRIAWMYYISNMTQQEIGDYFGLSRVKITRLLKKALEERIVNIDIKDKLTDTIKLEDKLKDKFKLKQAYVTPSPLKKEDLFSYLGKGGVDFLKINLRNNSTLGFGWGRTINAILPHLNQFQKLENIKIVALTGGYFSKAGMPNPSEIIFNVGKLFNAECYYPNIPTVLPDNKTKEKFASHNYYNEWYKYLDQADIALAGIGVVSPDGHLFKQYMGGQKDALELNKKGAIGDVVNEFFDINGKIIKQEISSRIFTIGIERLKHIPLVAGIAGGEEKVKPILGALNGRFINALITDENTAKKILEVNNKS